MFIDISVNQSVIHRKPVLTLRTTATRGCWRRPSCRSWRGWTLSASRWSGSWSTGWAIWPASWTTAPSPCLSRWTGSRLSLPGAAPLAPRLPVRCTSRNIKLGLPPTVALMLCAGNVTDLQFLVGTISYDYFPLYSFKTNIIIIIFFIMYMNVFIKNRFVINCEFSQHIW